MSASPADEEMATDTRLNAYVDGELSAADAAEVAALVTRDRGLARTVATLTRLKAELRAPGLPAPDLVLPSPPAPALRRRRTFAAAMLATAAAAAVVWLAVGSGPTLTRAPSAWDWHDRWVARASELESDERPAGAAGSVLQAQLARSSRDLYLPDLTAAQLLLVHTEFLSGPDGSPVLHAGYVGSRGCRISLFIQAEDPAGAPPGPIAAAIAAAGGTALTRDWRSGDLHYLVLARGMDPDHFATVGATIQRLTDEQRPPDSATAQVLAESRSAASPCRA